jgi:hypothetical protein
MPFGRRQQPPGGKPAQPPRPEPLRPVEAPPLQGPEPEDVTINVVTAAKEFIVLLIAEYDGGGGVHAETAIGAAAALTGEFAQRSTGLPIPEDKPRYVFGDAINDVPYEGADEGRATVWKMYEHAALKAGVPKADMPDPTAVIEKVVGSIGGPDFPPLTVPKQHYPREWSPDACVRLRPRIIAIADRCDLSRRELFIALAMATGCLFDLTKNVLPPAIGMRLATEITFGVAKMTPPNLVFG